MQQHSLAVNCVTRPGQILCLVARPRDNWERVVQLLSSIPGGNLAKVVPLDTEGQVPQVYQAMVRKPDVDYILTIGDVPPYLVQEISRRTGVPQQSILNEGSLTVEAWKKSKVQRTDVIGLSGYDLAHHTANKGSSALPIPMAALTGEVPALRGTSVVLERHESTTQAKAFELERLLTFYRYNPADSDLDVPVLARGNLRHDDLYVIIGTGNDIDDLFLYWNLRRVPIVRRYGIWLPHHLFYGDNLERTLDILRRWILYEDAPYLNTGGPTSWRPDLVKFVGRSRDVCDRIEAMSVAGWEWGTTGPLDGDIIHYVPQPLDMLLEGAGVRYGQQDDVQAFVDGGNWSVLLPMYPDTYGLGAVTEISHRSLSDIPSLALRSPSQHLTRTFPEGVAVYRTAHTAGRSEVVTLSLPTEWNLMRRLLGTEISQSDKAAPIKALIEQAGGIEKCDFLEDQDVLDFLEGAALESVNRGLKGDMMSIIDMARTGKEVEDEVDTLLRKVGDELRSQRKLWRAKNDLDRRGIGQELLRWLYDQDLFVAGIKLKCPKCRGVGYYQPHLLADFRCSACGWMGKVPLVDSQASVFYRPRDLLLSVAASGGLPVLLTLLRLHRNHLTARTYPGVKLPSTLGPREVDIVAWYEGQLYFYEVKHSGRQVHDALRLVTLAKEYGAIPVFAAYEGTHFVAAYLAEKCVTEFRYFDLGRPVKRVASFWNPTPAWKRGEMG